MQAQKENKKRVRFGKNSLTISNNNRKNNRAERKCIIISVLKSQIQISTTKSIS